MIKKNSLQISIFLLVLFSSFYFRISLQAHELDAEASVKLYMTQADAFSKLIETKGSRQALQELRSQSTTDKYVARNCHDLAHLIGHAAYKAYKNFPDALAEYDEVCNSGYLHGAIEEYLSTAQNPIQALHDVCSNTDPSHFIGWQCYHGVGHGVMFETHYNVPESLRLCDTYDNVQAAQSCANGVFMENFNTDGNQHTSAFVKSDDLFFPCETVADSLKGDCYIYAPVQYLNLHPDDYRGALKWCTSAPSQYEVTCATGVGSQIEKEHTLDPGLVERACLSGALWQILPCLRGAAEFAALNGATMDSGYAFCNELGALRKRICARSLVRFSSLFE